MKTLSSGRLRSPRLFCQFVWICNPAAFVPLIKNICQHAARLSRRPFFGFRFPWAFCSRSAKKIHFLCSHLIAKFFFHKKKWNRFSVAEDRKCWYSLRSVGLQIRPNRCSLWSDYKSDRTKLQIRPNNPAPMNLRI